ncbi:MAG: hypothetical protein RIR18_2456 [Pseudomonadota bacterium]
MANEQLAIYSSINLIMHVVEERLQSLPNEISKLDNVEFEFPEAQDGDYVMHMSKALHQGKKKTVFDPYLMANTYFLLESQHLNKCGVTKLPPVPSVLEKSEND